MIESYFHWNKVEYDRQKFFRCAISFKQVSYNFCKCFFVEDTSNGLMQWIVTKNKGNMEKIGFFKFS